MSRSGYSEDCDGWALICWRGAVASAIRGKKGQAFLKELLGTLDAMPEKKLVREELVTSSGEVCAIGSVMVKRGIDASELDPYDRDRIATVVGIAPALVAEIEDINDRAWRWDKGDCDEHRFQKVRDWVAAQIKESSK